MHNNKSFGFGYYDYFVVTPINKNLNVNYILGSIPRFQYKCRFRCVPLDLMNAHCYFGKLTTFCYGTFSLKQEFSHYFHHSRI